tara:strand:+ start:1876 stop:2829 length:954 start_codon:yes stop_codon:yes gene_type:complete
MKKFLLFSLKVLLIPILIIVVNIVVDYRSQERGISEMFLEDLRKNDSLTLKVNLPERKFIKYRIINDNQSFSNIVLGSSRSMIIGNQTSNEVLNLSVSSAILKDFIEIFNLIKKNNVKVKSAIIEISPWILNHHATDKRYLEFVESNYLKYLSYSYFLENITFPKYTLVENNYSFRKYFDGSINYGSNYQKNYIQKIKEYVRQSDLTNLEGFNKINDFKTNELIYFLNDLKKEGVQITFLKQPYPPSINSIILNRYPNILETDKIINQVSKEFNINIKGSFFPEEVGLIDEDYYDGLHLTVQGTKKLLEFNSPKYTK